MIIIICERCHKELVKGSHFDCAGDNSIWNHGEWRKNREIKDGIWFVCQRCIAELRGIPYREPIHYRTSYDSDWTKDGATMATDSWGGAGPDCISMRG